jgi:hypothetical protein
MNGRYKITLPPLLGNGLPRRWETEKRTAKPWHLFVETCRSLAADGLEYAVVFAITGDNPHLLITAWGDAVPKRKPHSPRRLVLPSRVKPEQCAVHAQEAEWFLPESRTRRNANTTHWRGRTGRYAELNAMAEEELRADVEFWRELELLSGQREHFKPGRTHETSVLDDSVLDDEVAA